MKTTWQIINKEIGTNQQNGSISSLSTNDTIVIGQLNIANIFNNYFTSVVDSINSNKIKDSTTSRDNSRDYRYNLHRNPCPKINWKYVSTHEIEKIIRSLESKTSSGYDELSIQVIKLSLPFVISPLTFICNSVLNSGIYPNRLKYAIVKPIFKKGSKQDISNYRPISILTSFSKILEKLIFNRLYNHLETNGILAQEQFGIRMRHSTEQAAFSLINSVLTALNNNQLAAGIFCDLQKAFDCVNHRILLDKLHFYGIHGKFMTLMESYLTNRYQKVSLNKQGRELQFL